MLSPEPRGSRSEIPTCPHRPPCPGCPRYGDARPPREALARLDELCAELGAGPARRVSGVGPGYRHRVRLMVRGRAGAPKIGIFEEGTHRIVDIPHCVVHHPLINEVALAFKQAMKVTRTPPYSDEAHAGLVRALQVVVERSSQTAQVVIVANAGRPDALGPLCDLFREALGPKLHSLWFNAHTARKNAILGPHFEPLFGPLSIEDDVAHARVFYPPDAFGQANPGLMDRIVAQIHEWVPPVPEAPVVELYAGVGAIGLGLLRRGHPMVFNEIGAGSLRGLELGLEHLRRHSQATELSATIVEGPAEAAVAHAQGAETVIVDPPRKGLGDEVCQRLLERPPKRLIYLSCGVDSFLRDARALSAVFSLRAALAYGLFPFTEHVETLALFEAQGRP